MEKSKAYDLLVSLGNGHFREEIRDSYHPEGEIRAILDDDIRVIVLRDAKTVRLKRPYWSLLVSVMKDSDDIFSVEELDEILIHEYNLDPVAVGGSAIFFKRIAIYISDCIAEARRTIDPSYEG